MIRATINAQNIGGLNSFAEVEFARTDLDMRNQITLSPVASSTYIIQSWLIQHCGNNNNNNNNKTSHAFRFVVWYEIFLRLTGVKTSSCYKTTTTSSFMTSKKNCNQAITLIYLTQHLYVHVTLEAVHVYSLYYWRGKCMHIFTMSFMLKILNNSQSRASYANIFHVPEWKPDWTHIVHLLVFY